MRIEQNLVEASATVLLVDDEPKITEALRRVLRHRPYRVLTAQSGAQALSLMQEHPIDLVVSDARMPGMDGTTLLGKIYERWPTCIRILLTGYPDIDTSIKAINDGRVYRYLSKPWDDDEFCLTLEQSLAHSQAKQEHAAGLAATAKLLENAQTELERSYLTATQVFSSLINQRLPKSRHTNHEVIALVLAYCSAHAVPEQQARSLEMAAALYNIGKLTWRDEMIALPSDRLGKEQRERYGDYPAIGEKLLMALEPAQDAALLIRHHQERWDGAGFPDGLAGDAIPWGARLLKLAVDTVEIQMGMVQERKIARDEVLKAMANYAGRLYDPLLCAAFIEVVANMPQDEVETDESVLVLETQGLEPGMILTKKLYSAAGTLLLSEGKVLSLRLIERLQEFEHDEGVSYKLHVRHPDPENDDE